MQRQNKIMKQSIHNHRRCHYHHHPHHRHHHHHHHHNHHHHHHLTVKITWCPEVRSQTTRARRVTVDTIPTPRFNIRMLWWSPCSIFKTTIKMKMTMLIKNMSIPPWPTSLPHKEGPSLIFQRHFLPRLRFKVTFHLALYGSFGALGFSCGQASLGLGGTPSLYSVHHHRHQVGSLVGDSCRNKCWLCNLTSRKLERDCCGGVVSPGGGGVVSFQWALPVCNQLGTTPLEKSWPPPHSRRAGHHLVSFTNPLHHHQHQDIRHHDHASSKAQWAPPHCSYWLWRSREPRPHSTRPIHDQPFDSPMLSSP